MAIPDESDFSCLHPTARVKFDGGKQAVVCDSCHMIVTYLGGDAVRVAELEAVIQLREGAAAIRKGEHA